MNVILKDASSKELTAKMPTMWTKLMLTKGKLKYSVVKEIYRSTQREDYGKHQRTLNVVYVTDPTKQRHTSPTCQKPC